jgi:hypothetical protein
MWRRGDLSYLLRKQPCILSARNRFRKTKAKVTYWNIARQIGKSFGACTLGTERAITGVGKSVKFAAQDQKSGVGIAFGHMEKILQDCPVDMLPKFDRYQSEYYFPSTGGRLKIAGGDTENMPRLRGQTADEWIVDEGAHIRGDLKKLIFSILNPQTNTTGGKGLVMTTPAESAGHYATELAHYCKSIGAYEEFTVWQNALMSDEEKETTLRLYGWCDACWDYERRGLVSPLNHTCSTAWQREYLCRFVTDQASAVVPEWTQEAERESVRESVRPMYFDAYTTLDGGFKDASAAVFALADHSTATLFIEDEWCQKGALGSDIAVAVAQKEQELWGNSPVLWTDEKKRYARCEARLVRTMDVDPMLAAEFLRNHGQAWTAINKHDETGNFKLAAVNQLNDFIKQRRLVIHPRCVNLIRQLHNATWAASSDGSRKKTYTRNSVDGHFDLVDALVYTLRVVDFTHNPNPPERKDVFKEWVDPEELDPYSPEDEELRKAFNLSHGYGD